MVFVFTSSCQLDISSVLNEIILDGGVVKSLEIPNESYHTLYTPQKIREYEIYK